MCYVLFYTIFYHCVYMFFLWVLTLSDQGYFRQLTAPWSTVKKTFGEPD